MTKRWRNMMLCAVIICVQVLSGVFAVQAAAPPMLVSTQGASEEGLLDGINAENYPSVDGSTATLPLSAAVYQLVTGCSQKEADQAITHTKTTNSWLRLIADEVDLLIVADKNAKVDAAIAESGVSLEIKPIALDAFIFMANEDNPVQSLTQEQLVGIYSGQITNWSQVGGQNQEIVPFQRNENAGSQTAMKSLVMKGQEMIPPEKLEIGTMDGLLEAVAAYNNKANALGYSYYYYANLMYRTPGLRFMAVDGVMPSSETVQKGEYPYIAQYYAAIRSDEPLGTPARKIYDWLTGTQGQELAADLGYIPLDSSIKPDVIHTDEVAADPIPIEENERLAVRTDRGTLVVLDRNGKVTERFDNATLGNSFEETVLGGAFDAVILDIETPITIAIKTGEGEWDYKVGLYSLKEGTWMLEPQYDYLLMLSDTLCTDSSLMGSYGSLMKTDGTILSTKEYQLYRRQGDYIVSETEVYNLEGECLSMLGGFPIGYYEEYVVYNADGLSTVCQDVYGKTIWVEGSGLGFCGFTEQYINWIDPNGAGVITDHALAMIMNDVLFWELNPEYKGSGYSMQVQAVNEDKGELVVQMTDMNSWKSIYFVCDSTFRIIRALPLDEVFVDYETEDIWICKLNNGMLTLEKLWNDEVIEMEFAADASNGFSITSAGKIICLNWFDTNWQQKGFCLINGENQSIYDFSYSQIREVEDDVYSVYSYDWNSDYAERIFFTSDGEVLCGNEDMRTLYANTDFRCVQYGSYIYIENYDGLLYVRLLATDEEIEEPRRYNYWE